MLSWLRRSSLLCPNLLCVRCSFPPHLNQQGDQLCSFAGVSLGPQAGDELQRVAAALQANEGREVEALFLRQGAPVALKLTPQRWSGRGLLGCHLRPMGRQ